MNPVTPIIQERFAAHLLGTHAYRGNETIVVAREGLLAVAAFLRDDPRLAFDFLMDLSCVDYLAFGAYAQNRPSLATPSPLPYFMKTKPITETWQRAADAEHRFEVVYHFYSLARNHRLRVKVPVAAADAVVPSVTRLWNSANWFEREVWDMFGVKFSGHPDLKRILMYEEFDGHALRKDYPVTKRQPLLGPVN